MERETFSFLESFSASSVVMCPLRPMVFSSLSTRPYSWVQASWANCLRMLAPPIMSFLIWGIFWCQVRYWGPILKSLKWVDQNFAFSSMRAAMTPSSSTGGSNSSYNMVYQLSAIPLSLPLYWARRPMEPSSMAWAILEKEPPSSDRSVMEANSSVEAICFKKL